MSRKDWKLLTFYLVISILIQFYLVRPGDTIWTLLGWGVFCGFICFGLVKLVDWWLHD